MNKRTLTLKLPKAQGVTADDCVERICENCRFYDGLFCRHRAPYWNAVTGEAIWPTVDKDSWCGQFKRLPIASDRSE